MLNLTKENKHVYLECIENLLRNRYGLTEHSNYLLNKARSTCPDMIEYPEKIDSEFLVNVKSTCPFCGNIAPLYISDFKPQYLIMAELDEVEKEFENYSQNFKEFIEFDRRHKLAKEYNIFRNKIIICGKCLSYKRDKYPMQTNGECLLLNPLNTRIKISRHFRYDKNETMLGLSAKGKITIETLGLNRLDLKESRKRSYLEFMDYSGTDLIFLLNDFSFSQIEYIRYNFLNDDDTFRLFQRKSVSDQIKFVCNELIKRKYPYSIADLEIEEKPLTKDKFVSNTLKSNIWKANKEKEYINEMERLNGNGIKIEEKLNKIRKDISLKSKNIKHEVSDELLINEVHITNYKHIKDITIKLEKQSSFGSWLTILGENGSGKTTILKAIGLTLIKKESRIKYVEMNETAEVVITTDLGLKYSINKESEKYPLLLGYGAIRIKDGLNTEGEKGQSFIGNLFNPRVGLIDANEFLKRISTKDFVTVSDVIRKVFLNEVRIVRRDGEVFFCTSSWENKFDDLSEGYKTIIALSIDMMSKIKNHFEHYGGKAIVLIDEIENHLHPRWIIRLPNILKKTFPYIQFITTSHNPLILMELESYEVIKLNRCEDKSIIETFEESPENYTIDSLLTSEYFKISDTNPKKSRRTDNLIKYSNFDKSLTIAKDYEEKLAELFFTINEKNSIENYRLFLNQYLELKYKETGLSMKERIDQSLKKLRNLGNDNE